MKKLLTQTKIYVDGEQFALLRVGDNEIRVPHFDENVIGIDASTVAFCCQNRLCFWQFLLVDREIESYVLPTEQAINLIKFFENLLIGYSKNALYAWDIGKGKTESNLLEPKILAKDTAEKGGISAIVPA